MHPILMFIGTPCIIGILWFSPWSILWTPGLWCIHSHVNWDTLYYRHTMIFSLKYSVNPWTLMHPIPMFIGTPCIIGTLWFSPSSILWTPGLWCIQFLARILILNRYLRRILNLKTISGFLNLFISCLISDTSSSVIPNSSAFFCSAIIYLE